MSGDQSDFGSEGAATVYSWLKKKARMGPDGIAGCPGSGRSQGAAISESRGSKVIFPLTRCGTYVGQSPAGGRRRSRWILGPAVVEEKPDWRALVRL